MTLFYYKLSVFHFNVTLEKRFSFDKVFCVFELTKSINEKKRKLSEKIFIKLKMYEKIRVCTQMHLHQFVILSFASRLRSK